MTRRYDQGTTAAWLRGALLSVTGGILAAACAADPPPRDRLVASSSQLAAAEAQSETVSPAPPARGSAYGDYLAGLIASHDRDLTTATDYMIRALERDPENGDLLRQTFALAAADGRNAESLRLAPRLLEIQPRGATPNLVLAVEAVIDDDFEEAARYIGQLPGRGLPMIYAPLLKGWLHIGQGDLEAAVDAAAELEQREGFATLLGLHRALIRDVAGDEDGAATAYRRMLDQVAAPSLRLAWLAGNFLERKGDREAAAAVYRGYREANPESVLLDGAEVRLAAGGTPEPAVATYRDGWAEALFNIAGVLSRERADDLALIHAHLALRLKPDLGIARLLIGEILESHDRGEAAIDAYRRIDPASPLAWSARLRIAEVLVQLERSEEALVELETLAGERPERFEPLFRMGNLLRVEERFEDAAAAYDRAYERLEQDAPRPWSLFYFRGISLERDGRWERAEQDFLTALEIEPEQPYVMNYLAYSWVEKKVNLDEAQDMLVRAVQLRPNDGYIVDSLGWVHYRLGAYLKAVRQLERAVELRPQDPVINDHLGDAYWRVGRRQEARFQWRRALSLEPEEELVPTIEVKIEQGLADLPENI